MQGTAGGFQRCKAMRRIAPRGEQPQVVVVVVLDSRLVVVIIIAIIVIVVIIVPLLPTRLRQLQHQLFGTANAPIQVQEPDRQWRRLR